MHSEPLPRAFGSEGGGAETSAQVKVGGHGHACQGVSREGGRVMSPIRAGCGSCVGRPGPGSGGGPARSQAARCILPGRGAGPIGDCLHLFRTPCRFRQPTCAARWAKRRSARGRHGRARAWKAGEVSPAPPAARGAGARAGAGLGAAAAARPPPSPRPAPRRGPTPDRLRRPKRPRPLTKARVPGWAQVRAPAPTLGE